MGWYPSGDWYQAGDPGIFGGLTSFFNTAASAALGTQVRAAGGQFGFGGILRGIGSILQTAGPLVGGISPGAGQAISGAGSFLAGGSDSMGIAGPAVATPEAYAAPAVRIQPYNAVPNFVAPVQQPFAMAGFEEDVYDDEDFY